MDVDRVRADSLRPCRADAARRHFPEGAWAAFPAGAAAHGPPRFRAPGFRAPGFRPAGPARGSGPARASPRRMRVWAHSYQPKRAFGGLERRLSSLVLPSPRPTRRSWIGWYAVASSSIHDLLAPTQRDTLLAVIGPTRADGVSVVPPGPPGRRRGPCQQAGPSLGRGRGCSGHQLFGPSMPASRRPPPFRGGLNPLFLHCYNCFNSARRGPRGLSGGSGGAGALVFPMSSRKLPARTRDMGPTPGN